MFVSSYLSEFLCSEVKLVYESVANFAYNSKIVKLAKFITLNFFLWTLFYLKIYICVTWDCRVCFLLLPQKVQNNMCAIFVSNRFWCTWRKLNLRPPEYEMIKVVLSEPALFHGMWLFNLDFPILRQKLC